MLPGYILLRLKKKSWYFANNEQHLRKWTWHVLVLLDFSLNYQAAFTPRCTTNSPGSRKRGDSLSVSFQGNITKAPSNDGTKAGPPRAGLPWSPGSPGISMSWAIKRKEMVPSLAAHTIQEDWPNKTHNRRAIRSSTSHPVLHSAKVSGIFIT